jgi:hypothetical protein
MIACLLAGSQADRQRTWRTGPGRSVVLCCCRERGERVGDGVVQRTREGLSQCCESLKRCLSPVIIRFILHHICSMKKQKRRQNQSVSCPQRMRVRFNYFVCVVRIDSTLPYSIVHALVVD